MTTAQDDDGGALLLSARLTARALGISERTLHTLTADGVVPSVRIGRRRLYSRAALIEWIGQAQRAEGGGR